MVGNLVRCHEDVADLGFPPDPSLGKQLTG